MEEISKKKNVNNIHQKVSSNHITSW